MTATTSQPAAAPVLPPKKKGERLTWGEINALPKGTYLAEDSGRYASFYIWRAKHYLLWHAETGFSDGSYSEWQRFPPEDTKPTYRSPFRLATQAEIKKAQKAHVRAWRKAHDEQAKALANSLTGLMLAERELGLDIPSPPRDE